VSPRLGLARAALLLAAVSLACPACEAEATTLEATGRVWKAGHAKFYSPGVFRRVAGVRGMKLRTDVNGYAAVTDCRRIGQIVLAAINGRRVERYQVLDCSHPTDRARHIRQGLVIEVDFQSAVRNGFSRRGRAPAVVYGFSPT
jgi:hypothetical protein